MGGFICTIRWPQSQIYVIFGSFLLRVVPNFAFNKVVPPWIWTKLFRHGDEKLEDKLQQHDEDAEWSKTGCRSPSRAHGKAYEQLTALICDSYAPRILCVAAIWRGYFAHREQNSHPKCLGNKSEIAPMNFIISPPPLHNFGLHIKWENWHNPCILHGTTGLAPRDHVHSEMSLLP